MAEGAGTDSLVKIAASVSGVSLLTVLVIAGLAEEQLWVAAPIIGCLVLLGVVLGAFASGQGGGGGE